MKKLLSLLTLAALSMGFSSCCSMFGSQTGTAGFVTETRQVGYNIVHEEVYTPNASGKGGMTQLVEKRVPITETYQARVPCQRCVRYYCPKKDCCGTTSEAFMKMRTAQGSTGSPHIGLIPTMRKLAD